MTVPGSAGFRFAGSGMERCNAFLFPMSRERFIADLGRVAPALRTQLANPGDVFEVDAGKVKHHVAASPIARMLEDDTRLLRFDPTAPIPPLQDPNPGKLSEQHLRAGVEDCLTGFARFVRSASKLGDPLVDEYRRLQATYAVGVVFDGRPERWLHVTFRSDGVDLADHEGDCDPADAGHRIVASALTAWAAREKSYFYLRAFSRQWNLLHAISAEGARATIEPKHPQDLLAYYLLRKAPDSDVAFKLWLDHQLAPYVRSA
jgi:hypothetical protein